MAKPGVTPEEAEMFRMVRAVLADEDTPDPVSDRAELLERFAKLVAGMMVGPAIVGGVPPAKAEAEAIRFCDQRIAGEDPHRWQAPLN